ncbi:N-acetyl-gamma-glutamyl-phosphate reductase [Sphingomonas mucosissima]|uniref:N-acetyl-gamma-glutamyl-phosphate reductase n=1 Tax=Sphingomonas mucosissima TaxID=370959 RepID=A0A245ZFM9_9SPHN|nr:N-acetyl-gamma-glutamyl-phosphate reductase [Sphingomonas mucosissima]OWK28552.1 N-acetyl-gamma-glutamyl-phosphate reductase [Sphingomonas mucosissima]
MTASIFIDGVAGTTGLEIRERLERRADLALVTLPEDKRKDAGARRHAINAADIVILCLPDDAAREAVALIDNPHTRVIDASSAYRVANGWTYGFPELGFDVAGATRVSNPGCYPTGFLALVAPLVRAGVLPADWPLTVNAVSGYSGGGKALIARFDEEQDLSFRSYGYSLAHKHVPEMQQHAGLAYPPLFAPAVARAFRGMIVEVPVPLAALSAPPSRAAMLDVLHATFDAAPLITVHDDQPDELLMHRDAAPNDRLDLWVFADPAGRQARLVAMLDNLGKGASGAAVQNLNLMIGADPLAGLVY